MAPKHTPLEQEALSEEARRAVAGPMKAMAARGLAPLSDPVDLVSVLYQIATEPGGAMAADAERSAKDVPERVLAGALADPRLDARVLDFFAARVVSDREDLLELVVQNPSVSGDTVAALAGRGSEKLVDLIAENEERLLAHPAVIASMYTNRAARMSTVDRVVELAVRNKVKVHGIAAWDEIANAMLSSDKPPPSEDADRLFAQAAKAVSEREERGELVEVDDEGDGERKEIPISQMTVPAKIRLATLGNPFVRSVLIRDPIRPVAMAAVKAPGVSDSEAVKYASNTSLNEDVVKYIANRREWTKLYSVKLALVQNPKTPLPSSMRLMQHLRERDIRQISRSKGVPSALAAQAKKLIMQRRGGK